MVFLISFMLTCSYIHTSSFEKHYFLPEATAAVGKSLIFLDIRANNLMSRGKAGHQTREWYHWADLSIFVLTFKRGDQFIVMYFIHCCIIIPNHSIQNYGKYRRGVDFWFAEIFELPYVFDFIEVNKRINIHFLSFYLIFSGLIHNILLLPSTNSILFFLFSH